MFAVTIAPKRSEPDFPVRDSENTKYQKTENSQKAVTENANKALSNFSCLSSFLCPEGTINPNFLLKPYSKTTLQNLEHFAWVNQPGKPLPSVILSCAKVINKIQPILSILDQNSPLIDVYPLRTEDDEISYLASLRFSRCLYKTTSEKHCSAKLEQYLSEPKAFISIVLPALFYRDVFIKAPDSLDKKTNDLESLYIFDEDQGGAMFKRLLTRNSQITPDVSLENEYLIGTKTTTMNNDQFTGLICFEIKSVENITVCSIKSLKLDQEFQKNGLATILMGYAYYVAKRKDCKSINLETTPEAFSLYLSLGFKPSNPNSNIQQEEWNKLTLAQKKVVLCQILATDKYVTLAFDMTNSGATQIFETRVQQMLRPSYFS
jgi:GNAT superfamily N-acetyltransferase